MLVRSQEPLRCGVISRCRFAVSQAEEGSSYSLSSACIPNYFYSKGCDACVFHHHTHKMLSVFSRKAAVSVPCMELLSDRCDLCLLD